MNLYQKYRPTKLEDVIGNEKTVKSLEGMLSDSSTCPHTFLLHGPTGCGKTTIARIIAEILGCSDVDYKEMDTADFRGIDTVREMIRNSSYQPLKGKIRVWTIDECHKLTNDAQNALLKLLEKAGEKNFQHAYFILATTDPQKIIKTIRGRCTQLEVAPLSDKEMHTLLRNTSRAEGVKLTKSVYDQIIDSAEGLPRNALQILDQVVRVDEEHRLETAKKAADVKVQSIELCRALIKQRGWKYVSGILKELKGEDPESIRRQVLGYTSSVLINNDDAQAAHIMEEFIEPFYNTGFPGLVFACYVSVNG